MNLIIDIGNTRIKAALYNGNTLFELKLFNTIKELLLDTKFIKQANKCIIGSVVDQLEDFYNQLNAILPTIVFTTQTKIPLTNLYKSTATLGSDRLLASVAAYNIYPKCNVLVIDAGTCIKYNFTNYKNEYLGGGISPGIQMRFKALHQFTDKLPLIPFTNDAVNLIGDNTQNSILSGVLNGCVAEIDEIINQYKTQVPDTLFILTGGDSDFLAKRLKNSIFAHQNLVLKGLNDILNYNLENN